MNLSTRHQPPGLETSINFIAIRVRPYGGGWFRERHDVELVGMPSSGDGDAIRLVGTAKRPWAALSIALDGRLTPQECSVVLKGRDPLKTLKRLLVSAPDPSNYQISF